MKENIKKITKELKKKISQKYNLQEMRLFGSSGRGTRNKDSDIDVFLRLPEINREIEEDLFDTAYDFELKYGYTIDLFVFDNTINKGINAHIPVYQNILKEGILI